MKKVVTTILSVYLAAGCVHTTQAQLGGLVKKAKDKVKEAAPEKSPVAGEAPAGGTQPATQTAGTPNNNRQTNASKPASTSQPQERLFEYPAGEKNNITADPRLFPFHDKYIGQIVFAKEKLTVEKTTESAFTNTFNVGDAIYGRVMINSPVYNYPIYYPGNSPSRNQGHNWFVQVTINGDRTKTNSFIGGDNNAPKYYGWTSWQVIFYGKGADAVENKDWFIKTINELPEGEHKMEMELWGGRDRIAYTSKPIAAGTFTLVKKGNNKLGSGRTWAGFESKMKNAELEKQMVETMNAKAAKDGWKEQFSKAKITTSEWNIVKNEYTGEKLYRTIEGVVYAKWPDGHCTAQDFSFIQYWKGTAFSKTLELGGIGNQTTLDCN